MVAAARRAYSRTMPEARPVQLFRIVRRAGNADRLVLRSEAGDRVRYLVIAQYRGPELPATLTDPLVEPRSEDYGSARAWRLTSREGRFDFEARAVDQLEECAALYTPLHRAFELRRPERLALGVLLWLLRLPVGARWLRRWQARRAQR